MLHKNIFILLSFLSLLYQIYTRCRPSKRQQCIPDVVIKNEGSMVQFCRNINMYVVTQIYAEIYLNVYDRPKK